MHAHLGASLVARHNLLLQSQPRFEKLRLRVGGCSLRRGTAARCRYRTILGESSKGRLPPLPFSKSSGQDHPRPGLRFPNSHLSLHLSILVKTLTWFHDLQTWLSNGHPALAEVVGPCSCCTREQHSSKNLGQNVQVAFMMPRSQSTSITCTEATYSTPACRESDFLSRSVNL